LGGMQHDTENVHYLENRYKIALNIFLRGKFAKYKRTFAMRQCLD